MSPSNITFRNGKIFDGTSLLEGQAAQFEGGRLARIGPDDDLPRGDVVDLNGDILSPGYVDLQVNGGDGVMFNDDPSCETLERMAAAHRKLGVVAFLPTLITDSAETTHAAIEAAIDAVRSGTPGVMGLHLEGPHLSIARKGAHDPAFIRPMGERDLDTLLRAARTLPLLKVTLAPESATEEQVATLSNAGVLVSLGHTDASFETCSRYFAAGARCVTHLFNAMSQLGNREPGLVGAALAHGGVSAGLIADAVHVHPETMKAAWAAKTRPGRIFLVSDAMAVAGTDRASFELGGRTIQRRDGVLTLSDGTLAGADLDLTTAVKVLTEKVKVPLEDALQSAISVPAALIGAQTGLLDAGRTLLSDMIRISSDLGSVSTPSGPSAM